MRILIKFKRMFRRKFKLLFLTTIVVSVVYLCFQMYFVKVPPSDVIMRSGSFVEPVKHIIGVAEIREDQKPAKIYPLLNSPAPNLKYVVSNSTHDRDGYVRGIKHSDISYYKPNIRGNFVCLQSRHEINYTYLNDDYCDCLMDGSDEPGTNACLNGRFYCHTQMSGFISSNRVNDGICDCCDGSDEWAQKTLAFRLPESVQKTLGRYQSPCPNVCRKQ